MSECANCRKPFSAGSCIVPCIICRCLFHADTQCANLTVSETRVLDLRKTPMMVYRCQTCTNQSGLYLDVRQMISELKEDIQKLNNVCTTVDDLNTQYEVTKQEVEDLKIAHQSIEVMQSQITTMESDINSLKSTVATVSISEGDESPANLDKSMISTPDSLASEIQDRFRRSTNIILYKIPEHQQEDDPQDHASQIPNDRSSRNHDFRYVQSILNKIHNIDVAHIKVRRLNGDSKNGPRPILVNLHSADEVMRVIRNKKLLPSIINVSSDKTPTQRAQLKSLIKKVEDHNLPHPNEQKKIKYIRTPHQRHRQKTLQHNLQTQGEEGLNVLLSECAESNE